MLHLLSRKLRHWISLLVYSWAAIGPTRIARKLLPYTADAEARRVDCGFDARFGTDTNAELTPEEAGIPVGRRAGATMYLPSLDEDLAAMLEALAWPDALLRETTFIDIGSGKGRAVFLAGMRAFREVIGVELSPVLHAVAERNCAVMRASGTLRSNVRLTLADATQVELPRGPVIAYLYHPFREPLAAKVVDRIVASLAGMPRPVAILYGYPTLQRPLDPDVFARGGLFQEVRRGARVTRRFEIGWSVFTNQGWLDGLEAAA